MRRNKCLLLILLLFASCRIYVSAAEVGSLKIVEVEDSVCLYHAADSSGVLTEPFRNSGVTDLGQTSDDVKNAQLLAQYAHDNGLSGWKLVPEDGQVFFSPLEEGIYLACSMSEPEAFSPFLVSIPTEISGELVYHIVANPKDEEPSQPTTPTEPTEPTEPSEPEPEIPQTGRSVLPKYMLLFLGIGLVAAGVVTFYRGREREV